MDIKFAIFDMDGTLVDSMGYWNRLADEYLAKFGLPGLSPALKEESIALTMLGTGALFIREFGIPGTPEQIADDIGVQDVHRLLHQPGPHRHLPAPAGGAGLF